MHAGVEMAFVANSNRILQALHHVVAQFRWNHTREQRESLQDRIAIQVGVVADVVETLMDCLGNRGSARAIGRCVAFFPKGARDLRGSFKLVDVMNTVDELCRPGIRAGSSEASLRA